MNKRNLKGLISFAVVLLLNSQIISVQAETTDSLINTKKMDRLAGNDRMKTSVMIAKKGWNQGTEKVIIVNGYGFADALCAGPLARKYDAPILLTSKDELDSSVFDEIKTLNPKQIIIVGGTGVVSDNVKDSLSKITSDIVRFYGQDRYETSLAVAKEFGNVKNIVVASGQGYADALSIAPIAAKKGMPIILSSKEAISLNVGNYISSQKIEKTYVVGGEGAISANVMDALKNPQRLSGVDRFQTNLSVLKAFEKDINFDNIYIALGDGPTGNEFADALSGSGLAAKMSSAIVLTNGMISKELADYIESKVTEKTVLTSLGGEKIVPESIGEKILKEYANKTKSEVQIPVPSQAPTSDVNLAAKIVKKDELLNQITVSERFLKDYEQEVKINPYTIAQGKKIVDAIAEAKALVTDLSVTQQKINYQKKRLQIDTLYFLNSIEINKRSKGLIQQTKDDISKGVYAKTVIGDIELAIRHLEEVLQNSTSTLVDASDAKQNLIDIINRQAKIDKLVVDSVGTGYIYKSENYGTKFSDLLLPNKAEIRFTNRTSVYGDVVWSSEGYNSEKPGFINISGKVTLPDELNGKVDIPEIFLLPEGKLQVFILLQLG